MSPFLASAARFAERVRINQLEKGERDGRAVWIKRRRRSARPILAIANGFFAATGNPIRGIADLAAWQRWEIDSFQRLHGDHFQAFAEGEHTVIATVMPGVSLASHLDGGTLTPGMAAAAGQELRRAHELRCSCLGGRWSHGDPHTGNFVFDAGAERARLIDFEVRHRGELSCSERHADDLLVFLQDVIGRISAADWLPVAHAFLSAYDRPEIAALLAAQLVLPRGVQRLWWAVRTSYLSAADVSARLEQLRETLTSRPAPASFYSPAAAELADA